MERETYSEGALNELLNTKDMIVAQQTSAAATVQTLTRAAIASTKIHVTGVVCWMSDRSAAEFTIALIQGAVAKTIKVPTGANGVASLTGYDFSGDSNTLVSIAAPAGGAGVTSVVTLITYTEKV